MDSLDLNGVFSSDDDHTGFKAFSQLEDNTVNFMTIPDLVLMDPSTQLGIINEALLWCEQKKSIFFIADPPYQNVVDVKTKKRILADDKVSEMINFKHGTWDKKPAGNALNSEYGALYMPWVGVLNNNTGKNVLIPPSGCVAGIYANTDETRGVFKAPAGTESGQLQLATTLATSITANEQGQLNPNGIDAIRNLPDYGICIWGARTLSLDPMWQYISVRRLMIFLEQSIKQSLMWAVFEPNDQRLWGSVRREIEMFLTDQWRAGALFGATPGEAFYVTVDASNNPPDRIAQGILTVDVGVSPVRPAEFIVLKFAQVMEVQPS